MARSRRVSCSRPRSSASRIHSSACSSLSVASEPFDSKSARCSRTAVQMPATPSRVRAEQVTTRGVHPSEPAGNRWSALS